MANIHGLLKTLFFSWPLVSNTKKYVFFSNDILKMTWPRAQDQHAVKEIIFSNNYLTCKLDHFSFFLQSHQVSSHSVSKITSYFRIKPSVTACKGYEESLFFHDLWIYFGTMTATSWSWRFYSKTLHTSKPAEPIRFQMDSAVPCGEGERGGERGNLVWPS